MTDRNDSGSTERTWGSGLPQFPIVGDPESVADVAQERRAEEIREAYDRIAARLPEHMRERFRAEAATGFVGQPLSSHDPEIARLWSRILSLMMANEGDG